MIDNDVHGKCDFIKKHNSRNKSIKEQRFFFRRIRAFDRGSLFLIACLNLLPIYVSFRKRKAPQKWKMNGKNSGKAKRSFPMELITVGAFLFLLKIS